MREEKTTFCRICEVYCGLVATVEDGRVTKLRPDREHIVLKGYSFPKGITFHEVVHRRQHDAAVKVFPAASFQEPDWSRARIGGARCVLSGTWSASRASAGSYCRTTSSEIGHSVMMSSGCIPNGRCSRPHSGPTPISSRS